jgi:hypothetical protein
MECMLKKVMLNRSRVCCGMGFNNLGFGAGGGGGRGRAIIMLFGNNSKTGK